MALPTLDDYRSLADVPFLQARARGAEVALVHEGGALGCGELDLQVRRLAAFLQARGLSGGARVAILLPNLPAFAVGWFGAIAAGAIAVPVNLRLSPPEVGYVLRDSGAEALLTTASQLGRLGALPELAGLRLRLLAEGDAEGAVPLDEALQAAPLPAPAEVEPAAVATLLYTSGTTGFPKGAMVSHQNALWNARGCREVLGYRAGDVGLASLPLFHVTGLCSQLLALLAAGGSLVLQREYDTEAVLQAIGRHQVSALFFVPAIYKLLTLRADPSRHALGSVRLAAYGGAPMDPDTIRAVQALFPARLHNCYGLTETTSLTTVLPSERALSHAHSVGRAVPYVELEVRDGEGRRLGPGEPGELLVRGPNVVQGYWRAPEKTAQALGDGWLRTGDLAAIDAEGLVTILDRLKDLVNRGGEKVYCLEVEHVLAAFPGVAEAALVGGPHPVFGEVPVAFVATQPGLALDREALRRHCAERLADYKVPVAFHRVSMLPRNPGGKVLKQELRRALATRPEETLP